MYKICFVIHFDSLKIHKMEGIERIDFEMSYFLECVDTVENFLVEDELLK